MKKIIRMLIICLLIALTSVPSFAAKSVGVTLNNYPISYNANTGYPFIDSSGRTLVPFRQTMEAAGFIVAWDSVNNIASVSDANGTKVSVKIGDNYIIKEINSNGIIESSKIKNDTFAQVVNNRTYLPIRAVFECFGASVSWDNTSSNVIVNTSGISSNGLTAEQIYSKYSSAVFYIEIYDAYGNPLASGSGFFIDSKGTAITNFHVIEGASSAKVTTTDGKTYSVEGVFAYDKALDIAKIKVSGSGFSYVNIANSINVTGGSKTYAIGSPLGLDNTISEGIVSNPNRIIGNLSYYQITTPISHGSSGGALFDKNGNVIGITCGGFVDGQNLNLAIPITNITKLSGTTVTKLSTILSDSNVTLSLSNNNVELDVGRNTDVTLSFANYDSEVEADYLIGDESIITATWGNWNGNNIPLNINAVRQGSTTITINLYDYTTKKALATTTINVSINSSSLTPYYSGFYPAPNLGGFFGVPTYYKYETSQYAVYYYDQSDLRSVSNFITEYAKIVTANGFSYSGSFDDEYGHIVLYYINSYYGLTLYTSFKDINGTRVYVVTVSYN